MEKKLTDPEIVNFFKEFIIPMPNFDNFLPVVDKYLGGIKITFGANIPEKSRIQYTDNVYGSARFLSDFVKKDLGATKELPYESEYESGLIRNYRTINPNFYFQIRIIGKKEDHVIIDIDTEYYLQYMDHSCDYSKKYNELFKQPTKQTIWNFIVETANDYINRIKEYNTGLKKQEVIKHYIGNDIKLHINNRKNDYEVIGNLKEYPEVIQLLGLTQGESDDAHGMNDMGFAD